MKQCSKCKVEKEEICFNNKRQRKDGSYGLHSYCKVCQKEFHRQHYLANKKDYFEKAKRYDKKYKLLLLKKVLAYFKKHPCVDCGETNPVVLDFDHRDPTQKEYDVATLVHRCRRCWDKILKEIKKCDVRCSNCHRIKTARDRNYLILSLLPEI